MKKKYIIVLSVVIIIILIIGGFFFFRNLSSNKIEKAKTDLNDSLKEMGKSFYEDYYRKETQNKTPDEIKNQFDVYVSTGGIQINLDSLSNINKEDDIAAFNKYKCNKEKTKIIIYPKEPYTATDYEIEAELECSFE